MATAGLQRTGLLSSAESSPSNSTGAGCFSNPSYRTLGPCSYSAHYAKPDKKSATKVGADLPGPLLQKKKGENAEWRRRSDTLLLVSHPGEDEEAPQEQRSGVGGLL